MVVESQKKTLNRDQSIRLVRVYLCAVQARVGHTVGGAEVRFSRMNLKKVLGGTDMDAFKKQWQAWVLTLRFP